MPRETIASVKRACAAKMRKAAKEQMAGIDSIVAGHTREMTALKNRHFEEVAVLRSQSASRMEDITSLREMLHRRDARIDELLKSNNDYQAQARAARADVVRLQAALSDAARLIAVLGQRAE